MDARAGRRGGANTVTLNNNPPAHIPRAALFISLAVLVIAVATHFIRAPAPRYRLQDDAPYPNITSLSDLVRTVFDTPKIGHFFRSGCLSRRSLQCHTLQHVSHVLDHVRVLDEGDSYVFRISKHRVSNMRRDVLLRRASFDTCTPWQDGSFFMKFDWLLMYHFPRSLGSTLFGTTFTEAAFRRDRWGWCTGTTPFADYHIAPTPSDDSASSHSQPSQEHTTTTEQNLNDQSSKQETPGAASEMTGQPHTPGRTYRDNPINHDPREQGNMVYA